MVSCVTGRRLRDRWNNSAHALYATAAEGRNRHQTVMKPRLIDTFHAAGYADNRPWFARQSRTALL